MKSGSAGSGVGEDPTNRADVLVKKDQVSLPWTWRFSCRDGDRTDAWIVETGNGEGDSSREDEDWEGGESEDEAYKEKE